MTPADPHARTARALAAYLVELRDLVTDDAYRALLPAIEQLAAVTDVPVPAPRERHEPAAGPFEMPIPTTTGDQQ